MKRKRFTEEHAAGRVAGHERSQDETRCLQDFRTGPHARPVDGLSVDGALCFGGSPETRCDVTDGRHSGQDRSLSRPTP